MSHSVKIVSAIFYEHALAAILAASVIHAMKREQSRILAVSAILAVEGIPKQRSKCFSLNSLIASRACLSIFKWERNYAITN
jgi:hypothetical protein